MIVGLFGGSEVGKSHLARTVLLPRGFVDIALADDIKTDLISSGALSWESAYVDKPPGMRMLCNAWSRSMRVQFGDDYWCRRAEIKIRRLLQSPDIHHVVVSDVRFPWEVAWAQDREIPLIEIKAPARYAKNKLQHDPQLVKEDVIPSISCAYSVNNDPANAERVEQDLVDILVRLGLDG